jgi:hypothetical protein
MGYPKIPLRVTGIYCRE